MGVNHYLYMWNLEHNGQTMVDLHALTRQNGPSDLFLGTNFRSIKQGDWFWLNLTKPHDHVVAVAEVAGEPVPPQTPGEPWTVKVLWQSDLTTRLLKKPLSFDVPQQSKQGSPQRLIPEVEQIFLRWLKGNYSVKARTKDEEVQRVLRQVYQRQGQQQFRNELIHGYGPKCLITGTAVLETLQAAHIQPVAKDGTHDPSNGLLLRADIHTLFDLHLITVDRDYKIHVSPKVTEKEYQKLHGEKLRLGASRLTPSKTLLHRHHGKTFL